MGTNTPIQVLPTLPRPKRHLGVPFYCLILLLLIVIAVWSSHLVKTPTSHPEPATTSISESKRADIAAQLGTSAPPSQETLDAITRQLDAGTFNSTDEQRAAILRGLQ